MRIAGFHLCIIWFLESAHTKYRINKLRTKDHNMFGMLIRLGIIRRATTITSQYLLCIYLFIYVINVDFSEMEW